MPESLPSQNDSGSHRGFGVQDILDHAPIGFFTSTPEGRYISVNPVLARMCGYDSPEEMIASITDIAAQVYADPADRAEFQRLLEEHGEVVNHECRFRRRDGTEFWGSRNARAVKDQEGRIVAYQGFNTDITERKKAERALLLMEDIIEFSSSAVATCDLEEKMTYGNPAFQKLWGYDAPEEFLGRPFTEFWLIGDEYNTISTALRVAGTWVGELKAIKKDGAFFDVQVSAATVFDENGKPIALTSTSIDVSKRKQAEEALQQSAKYYRAVFETSGAAQIIIEEDTIISLANSRFEELTGFPREDIEWKKSWTEFVHPDDLVFMKECHQVRRSEPGRAPRKYEFRLIDRHNEAHDIFLCVDVIPDTKQSVASLVDFTERKQAEQALRASDERFKSIISTSQEWIWMIDSMGCHTFSNNAIANILGYAPDEIVGKKFIHLLHEDDIARAKDILTQCNLQKKGWENLVLRWRHKDETYRYLESSAVPIMDAAGVPTGYQGSDRDITERKQAEETLKEERLRLANIIKGTNVGTWEWNVQTGELVINGRWAEIIGYTLEELAPISIETWVKFAHPDDLERVNEMLDHHFAGELCYYEHELRMKHKKGHWIWVQDRGQVVTRTSDGKPLMMFGTHGDITERKKAEEERDKLQAQLFQAQKMEAVGTLAGGVAHDFNNLLHAMSGNIEVLLQGRQTDNPDAKRLKAVASAINSAAQLVKQLLFFSRKTVFRKVLVDLNHEVERALRILERTIPKMIVLETRLDQSAWPLFADPVQIEQVLLNLANNAVDAMPGGGTLVIETRNMVLDEDFVRVYPDASTGCHVLLAVSDTGCGMDGETLEHVFDPFFTTKETGKGTGLGLPSVYGIVKSHGGHVQCYSEIGLGTTFKIFLPAQEQGVVQPRKEPRSIEIPGGNETILVVDDEREIRELTQEALVSFGYHVHCAASGEKALEIYQNHGREIDLVLLDLNMPGMGGNKCLQELLKLNPSVKVVIASGYSANPHGRSALSSGAMGFISKPYQFKALATTVRTMLDDKGTETQSR